MAPVKTKIRHKGFHDSSLGDLLQISNDTFVQKVDEGIFVDPKKNTILTNQDTANASKSKTNVFSDLENISTVVGSGAVNATDGDVSGGIITGDAITNLMNIATTGSSSSTTDTGSSSSTSSTGSSSTTGSSNSTLDNNTLEKLLTFGNSFRSKFPKLFYGYYASLLISALFPPLSGFLVTQLLFYLLDVPCMGGLTLLWVHQVFIFPTYNMEMAHHIILDLIGLLSINTINILVNHTRIVSGLSYIIAGGIMLKYFLNKKSKHSDDKQMVFTNFNEMTTHFDYMGAGKKPKINKKKTKKLKKTSGDRGSESNGSDGKADNNNVQVIVDSVFEKSQLIHGNTEESVIQYPPMDLLVQDIGFPDPLNMDLLDEEACFSQSVNCDLFD